VMAAPSRLTWLRLPPPSQPDSGPPALPICAKDSVRHRRWSCCLSHERREIVKARMRTHFVVVAPPRFDDALGLGVRAKHSRLRHSSRDALRDDPRQQCLEYELRPIIAAQEPRGAACANQAG